MEIDTQIVFQSDSEIVNELYDNHLNYLIQYNDRVEPEYCILYFSSNDIYYPNDEAAFTENIIKKERFEWYGNRIDYGYKHIFLRDIKKQWYLSGINHLFHNPMELLSFLRKETEGYKVIALGSSAGGYAAVLFGQQLGAERIYSFNGQFELNSLLNRSNEKTDPLVFRNSNNSYLRIYYDSVNFIQRPETIYYFNSAKSKIDLEQFEHIKSLNLNVIFFNTGHHGIPFLKCNLKKVLHLGESELVRLTKKVHHPLFFSLKLVGLAETLKGIYSQLYKKFKKK